MSITRYTPHLGQAFRQPAQEPAAFVRIAAPWFALMLAGLAIRTLAPVPAAGTIALVMNAVALGGFGFAWQRFLGGDQAAPLSRGAYALRLALCVVAYQSLQGFELVATILMGNLFAGFEHADLMVKGGQQIFQILIGGMFLFLPHFAMGTPAELRGTRLQEIVLASGISTGFGYVLGYLPFLMMSEMAREAFGPGVALDVIQHIVNFLAVTVAMGYFALVWLDLRATAPGPSRAQEPPAKPDPDRVKRTTRINKTTKRKA